MALSERSTGIPGGAETFSGQVPRRAGARDAIPYNPGNT
jgi:hypothetical protein